MSKTNDLYLIKNKLKYSIKIQCIEICIKNFLSSRNVDRAKIGHMMTKTYIFYFIQNIIKNSLELPPYFNQLIKNGNKSISLL